MNVARSVASRCARSVARRVTDLGDGSSTPGHTTANGQSTSLTIHEGDTLTIDAVITRDPAPWGANVVNYQLQFDGVDVGAPQASSEFNLGPAELSDIGQHRIVVIDTVTSREYPLRAVSVGVTEVPPTLTFLQGAGDASNSNQYTFSAQSLGEAASDRLIVVCVHGRATGALAVSSVSVGGVTANEVVAQSVGETAQSVAAIYMAEVPSGTTGDVVVTFGSTSLRAAIQVYRMTGVSATATDTDASADSVPTASVDVPTSGVVIAASSIATGTPSTCTWLGVTEDYDAQVAGESMFTSSASTGPRASVSGLSISADWSLNSNLGVFAAWGPV